jgi:cystathionine beta-synthase
MVSIMNSPGTKQTSGASAGRPPAVLDLIGNTPLVEVTRLDTGPCTLFLKLESQNPGGSIKDRIGRSMIEGAEARGELQAGGTVVEATAGNTGLGLALVARAKGYRVVLVVPDKMSTEKVLHLKALGAEVHMTRSDVGKGHPEYYRTTRRALLPQSPGRSSPTSSATRTTRRRTSARPVPSYGARPGSGSTLSSSASGRAARSRA